MYEQLDQLLHDVILAAIASHTNPNSAAEMAARAYAAGQAAFKQAVKESAAWPPDSQAAQ